LIVELDSPSNKLMNNASRILRVARGSGNSVEDVKEILDQYNQRRKIVQQPQTQKIQKLMVKQLEGGLTSINSRSHINFQQLIGSIPSHLLNQVKELMK